MKRSALLWMLFLIAGLYAQAQTVGLFQNDSASYNGYTLFAPTGYRSVYLIDNCGKLINTWNTGSFPGQSVYLLENGNLLHTGRTNTPIFNGGGQGGQLSLFDWDGNLLWQYLVSDSTQLQHHDVEPLPNGNILVLAWERKFKPEVIAAGHDTSTSGNELWPEQILELRPIGTDSAEIVWEWHAWDHIIQDYDNTKPNYGIVADHPELFDLNFFTLTGLPVNTAAADWMHCNSIDYNPVTDQITLSSRHWHEVWVIDHSTTTAEAAGHTGGNSGKGGDLLYRWGNPQTYGRGDSSDQKLFGPHDALFVPQGYPGEGNIMVFNNGNNRLDGSSYSSVDEITPPTDLSGNYIIGANGPYGPTDLTWTYFSTPTSLFYSHNVSGAQRQPNGTTLICEGNQGHFFEVDSAGITVWDYINPVATTGILNQNTTPGNNYVFRCERYPANYPGLQGQDLTPGDPIEGNPLPYTCNIVPEDTAVIDTSDTTSVAILPVKSKQTQVYPNPTNDLLTLDFSEAGTHQITITNLLGEVMYEETCFETKTAINTNRWKAGIYLVRIERNLATIEIIKIIKT